MNRKSNPWLSLIAVVLLAVILASICTVCKVSAAAETEAAPRFTIEKQSMGGSVYGVFIITDTVTGAQYLVYKNGTGIGMTHLEG
jgi:hypothetical protein